MKHLEDGNEILNDFETAILHSYYFPRIVLKYSFNLNYIAIYYYNIVKLINVYNGNLVFILAFDKDIYSVIENDLILYILFNDPDKPYFY